MAKQEIQRHWILYAQENTWWIPWTVVLTFISYSFGLLLKHSLIIFVYNSNTTRTNLINFGMQIV